MAKRTSFQAVIAVSVPVAARPGSSAAASPPGSAGGAPVYGAGGVPSVGMYAQMEGVLSSMTDQRSDRTNGDFLCGNRAASA